LDINLCVKWIYSYTVAKYGFEKLGTEKLFEKEEAVLALKLAKK